MKQETKELIDWIKGSCVQRAIREGNHYESGKAHDFLNSVVELEKNLTKGGIIQDINGNLCKDGDAVKTSRGSKFDYWTLYWSERTNQFKLRNIESGMMIALNDTIFEKVNL